MTQTNQCALPDERSPSPPGNGTPFVSGGEALFLLLLLLTVSMCVSVLLSPESRRRRRERLEREAREKARALHREQKRWARSVKTGMWLTQPDGAVCVCVADAEAERDDSRRSRRRRRRAAAKLALYFADGAPGTPRGVPGDAPRLPARGDGGDGGDGGSSTDSSGGGSETSGSETDSESDDDAKDAPAAAERITISPNGESHARDVAVVVSDPAPRVALTGFQNAVGEASGSGSATAARDARGHDATSC